MIRAEKVRKLLEEGVYCIDSERVVSEGEREGLQAEYRAALAELEALEAVVEVLGELGDIAAKNFADIAAKKKAE